MPIANAIERVKLADDEVKSAIFRIRIVRDRLLTEDKMIRAENGRQTFRTQDVLTAAATALALATQELITASETLTGNREG